MAKRSILISLGTGHVKRRKEALQDLANNTGFNSLSELIQKLADAAEKDPQETAKIFKLITQE